MGLTCIVTIHGIGFQQPPDDAANPPVPGYADHLHGHLRASLGDALGEDPEREHGGPVYVESSWQGVPADGLARLDAPLVRGERASIAHVALVYAPLEIPGGPRIGSALDAGARALLGLDHYAHPLGAARLLVADTTAALRRRPSAPSATSTPGTSPSLTPRTDSRDDTAAGHDRLRRLLDHAPAPLTSLTGLTAVVAALEEDVASYVCRNDLREQVRTFVQTALLRLAARSDVDAIVVNAHSQGTVVAYDVLARQDQPPGVRGLVTAGSPLRKYVDLFSWGVRAGRGLASLRAGWLNVYDPRDPVADPLRGRDWRVGDPVPADDAPTLLRLIDPDRNLQTDSRDCPVTDITVDNITHSTGGLRAHNYWDNEQFAPLLADVVTKAQAG